MPHQLSPVQPLLLLIVIKSLLNIKLRSIRSSRGRCCNCATDRRRKVVLHADLLLINASLRGLLCTKVQGKKLSSYEKGREESSSARWPASPGFGKQIKSVPCAPTDMASTVSSDRTYSKFQQHPPPPFPLPFDLA